MFRLVFGDAIFPNAVLLAVCLFLVIRALFGKEEGPAEEDGQLGKTRKIFLYLLLIILVGGLVALLLGQKG